MSLMACVVALGWPGEGVGGGVGGLLDVLVTLALVGLVCLLAASVARRRQEEKSDNVVPIRPDGR
jgi:uncharacterized membrane protein